MNRRRKNRWSTRRKRRWDEKRRREKGRISED
jgi:hypothetical protein